MMVVGGRLRAAVVSGLVAIGLGLACAGAHAQAWPQRSVRLIVPLGPGSAVDLGARLYAERLSRKWGQPVVVENIPGADGIVAVNAFVSAHDNHTLFFSFGGPVTTNPINYEKLSYDPWRDLVPVASAADNFLAVAVTTGLDVKTISDLVRLAKAQPGTLNWAATPGQPQFTFEGFLKSAGLDMAHVTYREFGTAFTDLGEGRIQAICTSLTGLGPSIQAGKVRVLAVLDRQRAPSAPDVPTVTEAGYPELTADGLAGFFGWRDMPNDIRERIAADVHEASTEPELSRRLITAGQAARPSTPAEFAAILKEQHDKMAAIAKAIGLKGR